jgi:hypothetical protein
LNKAAQATSHSLAAQMQADSARFRQEALEYPADLSLWTKLYTVSQIMLSAVQQERVPSALEEICSNLLGCEQLAIVEISRATGKVHFVQSQHLSPEMRMTVAEQGRLLESHIQREALQVISDKSDEASVKLSQLRITALVPLWLDEESSGAILLFELLPQRSGYDIEDREVLRLLSTHAGRCLRSKTRG